MKEIERVPLRPFTRFCMSIGAVPSSYLAGLTIEEQLLWFCSFLEKEVVPVVNNNSEVVEELQNYVEHYFDNLDVQEEINTKLDEMAESGELEELIAAYINTNALICFNNVTELKEAQNLVNGSYTKTLGYHSKNDGGSGLYKIRKITNDDIVDESLIIALYDNELIAELIKPSEMTPELFGAYGDGVSDDTTAIQNLINKSTNIKFLNKSYKITSSLLINDSNKSITGYGKDSKIIYDGNNSNDYIIKISKEAKKSYINNLYLDGNNKISGIVDGYEENITTSNRTTIKDITMENLINGLTVYVFGSNYDNILINSLSNNGINMNGTDSFYSNIRVYNASNYGVNCVNASNRLNNVKCAVCKVGFYFNTNNINANIETQENYQDNIILDHVVTSVFTINSNGANCIDEYEEITTNGDYGLVKMIYCREVVINGTIYSHATFLERKAFERYGLKMEGTNIDNVINLTYQNRDINIERTNPSMIQSDIFNKIEINGNDCELYNTTIYNPTISGTSRTTLSNVTTNSFTVTIVSIPTDKETLICGFPISEGCEAFSIGYQLPKEIEMSYVKYQYEANGSTHSFNLQQSVRRISYDENEYNKFLFTYDSLENLINQNAEYKGYVDNQTPISNRKILINANLKNYSATDSFNVKGFKIEKQ